jgi:hypothetical protein
MSIPKKVLLLGSGAPSCNTTGHWTPTRIRFNKYILDCKLALSAHANLPNNAFPLLRRVGLSDLKAIRQVRFTRPSLRKGEISILDVGNLTLDENLEGRKMETQFEVHFWNLSNRVRYHLDIFFSKVLFDKASAGDLHQLAKEIKVSYPYISPLVRGVYSIPTNLLVQLAQKANIDLEEVEKHIVVVRTRHGNVCNLRFPILPSASMASLVGHVFGDGYIGNKKRQFEYCNDNANLLVEVKGHIMKVFGLEPMTERANRVGYSSLVGEILEAFGAHTAPKVKSEKQIPEWIKSGLKEYKAAFLKALFDDDGSVLYSENYNAKGVNFYQIRDKKILQKSHKLLAEIKEMLQEFEIFSGEPHLRKTYFSHGEEHAISYINITNYKSILNFNSEIGLAEGDKHNRLQKIILRKTHNNFGGNL